MITSRLRVAVLGVCTIAIAAVACNKKDEIVKQLFQAFTTQTFTVPFEVPAITFAPASIDSVAQAGEPMNLDSLVRAETDGAFSLDDVTAVYLDELKISLSNADADNNLANFEHLKLTLKSVDPAIAEVQVCNTTLPDAYVAERSLPIYDDRDLKPILASRGIVYLTGVSARRNTSKVLNGSLSFRFDVK